MGRAKGLLASFIIGFFLSSNVSYANELKYSIGPICRNNKIVCKNLNEVPTCLKLEPKIHIELVSHVNGEVKNRFEPFCDFPNSSQPKCVDKLSKKKIFPKDVAIECVEYIECKNDESDKLAASCSQGRMPKCLGGDSEPNCELETVCENDSIPVCEYSWQANATGSIFH